MATRRMHGVGGSGTGLSRVRGSVLGAAGSTSLIMSPVTATCADGNMPLDTGGAGRSGNIKQHRGSRHRGKPVAHARAVSQLAELQGGAVRTGGLGSPGRAQAQAQAQAQARYKPAKRQHQQYHHMGHVAQHGGAAAHDAGVGGADAEAQVSRPAEAEAEASSGRMPLRCFRCDKCVGFV